MGWPINITVALEHFGSLASGAHKLWGIMGWPIVIAVALEHFGCLASGAHKPRGIMGRSIATAAALAHFVRRHRVIPATGLSHRCVSRATLVPDNVKRET